MADRKPNLSRMARVKLRQVIAQGQARAVVDAQYFEQRRAERMHRAASFDNTECEANAPRFIPT